MQTARAPFVVDAVREADYLEVVRLFRFIGPNYICDPDLPQTKAVFSEYVKGSRKRGFVARVADEVAGVLLFEITPTLSLRHAQVKSDGMAVDPRFRGMGIGKTLLRTVERFCDQQQPTSFMIRASDPRNISLYRSMEEFEERGVCFFYTPATPNVVSSR